MKKDHTDQIRSCCRCGRRRLVDYHKRPNSNLCSDCILVARDLGELKLWVT